MKATGRRYFTRLALSVVGHAVLPACNMKRALPSLASVPPFELIDQRGSRFASTLLDGKVWIANFIFTRCPTVCPTLTARMARVQAATERLGDAVHLVSFTVDPEFDTPERISEYAARFGAGRRWIFLTGTRQSIEQLVSHGLRQAMPARKSDPASMAHGSSAVLIDGSRRIRGLYRLDDAGVALISEDAAHLALKA
jgi:protein SCO1/2